MNEGIFSAAFDSVNTPMIIFADDRKEMCFVNKAAHKLLKSIFHLSNKVDVQWDSLINEIFVLLEEGLLKVEHNNHFQYRKIVKKKKFNRHLLIDLSKTDTSNRDFPKVIVATIKDITDDCIAEEFITHSMNITHAISNITSNFVGVFDMDEAVANTLEEIARITSADRVYIFELTKGEDSTDRIINTHEWFNQNKVNSQIAELEDLAVYLLPWWMEQLKLDNKISITQMGKIPASIREELEVLKKLKVKSLLVLPLKIKDKLIGFIGIDKMTKVETWNYNVQVIMQLAANNLSSVYEMKESEKKLIESDGRYRRLFNGVNAGIIIHKLRDNSSVETIMMANDYFCKLLGYSREELLQMSPEAVLSKQHANSTKALVEEITTKGQLIFELDLVTRDGEIIPVEILTNTCSFDAEQVLMSVVRDISKRRKAENEIKKLSRAIEQSPNVVIITDAKGEIEYVNQKFAQVTGYTAQEVLQQTPRILKSGKQDSHIYHDLWNTIMAGNEWNGELINKCKDNSTYWTHAKISPVRNDYGEVTHYIGIQEDITDRKKMEEQIQKRNQELSEALEKLRLFQQQLIQQEKMAGIGQLAAGVAHEINNPLGYVMSNFETLKKYHTRILAQLERLEGDQNLDFIVSDLPVLMMESMEGLERIGSIVKGLRFFSRADTQDRYERYDLNEGLENTLLIANNEIKYVAIVEKELGQLPQIEALPQQINQVLLNILVNASQAIKSKGDLSQGVIKVRTYRRDSWVVCEIEDNGIGIAQENLSQVFNPFYTTKPVGQGTGLGLSISYDIINNKHQGEIAVESTLNVGTIFSVKLPVEQPKRY